MTTPQVGPAGTDPRRLVPRTDAVLADPRLQTASHRLGPAVVKQAVVEAQELARAGKISPSAVPDTAVDSSDVPGPQPPGDQCDRCGAAHQPGRAPLSAAAVEALVGAAAERTGRVIRLTDEVVLLPTGPAQAMRRLAALPQPFTTSEARQALSTTRRVVIPLLEHLDQRGWTRREDAGHRRVKRSD